MHDNGSGSKVQVQVQILDQDQDGRELAVILADRKWPRAATTTIPLDLELEFSDIFNALSKLFHYTPPTHDHNILVYKTMANST